MNDFEEEPLDKEKNWILNAEGAGSRGGSIQSGLRTESTKSFGLSPIRLPRHDGLSEEVNEVVVGEPLRAGTFGQQQRLISEQKQPPLQQRQLLSQK